MTTVDPYARVAELRRAGWEVVEAFEELPTPGRARPAASGNEVGNAGTSADCEDLLLVPLPIHLHEEFVLKGLGAGFHVLCEKPAAGSVAAVQRMEEAAREHDRFLGFGFQHVLSGSMQRLLRLLRDNTSGPGVSATTRETSGQGGSP
jgi:predicted dehydrogenase